MYNNQPPPFRPPFPPNLGGAGTPPNFPPFPPGPGGTFTPPPFPPNFAPNGTPPQASQSAGMGFRPPPGSIPPRPSHSGIGSAPGQNQGLPPLPAGLPRPPSFGGPGAAPPGFKRDVKTTSVFVGGIAPGIPDITLHHLLNACGPLHELQRVEGANGKPQAFGFAKFESPEVVMRTIRCLNGVELPDMTPEGRRNGLKKVLNVRVDEKTRQFLEEFESTVGRSDDEESADASCRKSIAHIVHLLIDPTAPPPRDFQPLPGQEPINVVVPAHLQDLKEGDLPENQRVQVLDQIAVFREQAARREREKQRLDVANERKKLEDVAANPRSSTANYGYGNRGLENERKKKNNWDQPPQQQQQQQSPHQQSSHRGSMDRGNGRDSVDRHDPQGYDKPVNFVRPQAAEAKGESERTDEEEEELRRTRKARERDHALRERERRCEDRERVRLGNLSREANRKRVEQEGEERLRRRHTEIFEHWDDDEKMERGRDWFYTDRSKWRQQRQHTRNREYQEDLRDRHREEDERRKIEAESEEFLRRQMAELAELEERQKARGLLTEDAAPVKLAMGSIPRPEPKEEKKPAPAPSKVAFDEDEMDIDVDTGLKKKRTLVKLEYDGPVDKDEMSEYEKVVRRNAKLLEVKRMVPTDTRSLWATNIEWAAINQTLIATKLAPFVREKMKALLGEVDEDLAEFVFENLRDKKGPRDLVEGLEPVFAEEAGEFVTQLWRQLSFESGAYKLGLESGNVMV